MNSTESLGWIRSTAKKLGKCVICGERVIEKHSYFTAKEGYCHKNCL